MRQLLTRLPGHATKQVRATPAVPVLCDGDALVQPGDRVEELTWCERRMLREAPHAVAALCAEHQAEMIKGGRIREFCHEVRAVAGG